MVRSSAARIPDLSVKGQNLNATPVHPAYGKSGLPAALSCSILLASLAEMPPAILAAEPGAGYADKTVASGIFIAADRGGGDDSRSDRAADAGRDIAGPEAAVVAPGCTTNRPTAAPGRR
jgi:hypothetical protein